MPPLNTVPPKTARSVIPSAMPIANTERPTSVAQIPNRAAYRRTDAFRTRNLAKISQVATNPVRTYRVQHGFIYYLIQLIQLREASPAIRITASPNHRIRVSTSAIFRFTRNYSFRVSSTDILVVFSPPWQQPQVCRMRSAATNSMVNAFMCGCSLSMTESSVRSSESCLSVALTTHIFG